MSEDRRKTEKFPAVVIPTPPPGSIVRDDPPPSRPSGRAPASRPSMIDPEWTREEDTSVSRTTETAIQLAPPSREKNRALLTVVNGFNAGQVFSLDDRVTVLGRGRDATVRVDDAGVSRNHARILYLIGGNYMIEDLSSTNGTFLGGRRVERAQLQGGDTVQLGPNVVLAFALMDEKSEQLAKQLYESSTRDPLTHAMNRRYLGERLASEVAYANRHKTRLGLVMFDLDLFKKVNDTWGHMAGDEVLKTVSAHVLKMIRAEDVFARFGGEEFVVLVRGIEPKNVAAFAERIRRAIEKLSIDWEDQKIKQTVSLGVASLDECGDVGTSESLLLLADERLYQAKRDGRNRVVSG